MFDDLLIVSPRSDSYTYKEDIQKQSLDNVYKAISELCKDIGVKTITCFAEDVLSVDIAPRFIDLPFKYITSLGRADQLKAKLFNLFGENYSNLPKTACDAELIRKVIRRYRKPTQGRAVQEEQGRAIREEQEQLDGLRFCMRQVATEYIEKAPFAYYITWSTNWCNCRSTPKAGNRILIQHWAHNGLVTYKYSDLKLNRLDISKIVKEVNSCKK
jgi:hypothetical protein